MRVLHLSKGGVPRENGPRCKVMRGRGYGLPSLQKSARGTPIPDGTPRLYLMLNVDKLIQTEQARLLLFMHVYRLPNVREMFKWVTNVQVKRRCVWEWRSSKNALITPFMSCFGKLRKGQNRSLTPSCVCSNSTSPAGRKLHWIAILANPVQFLLSNKWKYSSWPKKSPKLKLCHLYEKMGYKPAGKEKDI